MGFNKTDGRREGYIIIFHRIGTEFLITLEFTEVLLEFREIRRAALW